MSFLICISLAPRSDTVCTAARQTHRGEWLVAVAVGGRRGGGRGWGGGGSTEGLGAEHGPHLEEFGEEGQHVGEAVAHRRRHLAPAQAELARRPPVVPDRDADV